MLSTPFIRFRVSATVACIRASPIPFPLVSLSIVTFLLIMIPDISSSMTELMNLMSALASSALGSRKIALVPSLATNGIWAMDPAEVSPEKYLAVPSPSDALDGRPEQSLKGSILLREIIGWIIVCRSRADEVGHPRRPVEVARGGSLMDRRLGPLLRNGLRNSQDGHAVGRLRDRRPLSVYSAHPLGKEPPSRAPLGDDPAPGRPSVPSHIRGFQDARGELVLVEGCYVHSTRVLPHHDWVPAHGRAAHVHSGPDEPAVRGFLRRDVHPGCLRLLAGRPMDRPGALRGRP